MGAEEVGFTEEGKDGEEGLGGADLVAEEFKGVGQGLADGPAEGAEAEGMEEGFGLVADAIGAVLEVAVVEAETGIDPKGGDAGGGGAVDLPLKVFPQGGGVVGGADEVADCTDIGPLHVAKNDSSPVGCNHVIDLIGRTRAGEVDDGGAGFQTGAGGGGLVGFDGKEEAFGDELAQDRKEKAVLGFGIGAGGVG